MFNRSVDEGFVIARYVDSSRYEVVRASDLSYNWTFIAGPFLDRDLAEAVCRLLNDYRGFGG